MRFSRIVGFLIIGAILGVLLVYLLGWRESPTIALVDANTDSAIFIIRNGQILKWESEAGAFSIVWHNGASPCKQKTISSHKDIFSGKQTATCEVTQAKPHASYSYGIGPYVQPGKAMAAPPPCYGCNFNSGESSNVVPQKLITKVVNPSEVHVSCGDTSPGGIYPDNNKVPAGSTPTLTWFGADGATIGPPTSFKNSDGSSAAVSCPTNGGYTCTFPPGPTGYPIAYSITASGAAPPYCGSGTATETLQAPQ
jgi:hypothetical protein